MVLFKSIHNIHFHGEVKKKKNVWIPFLAHLYIWIPFLACLHVYVTIAVTMASVLALIKVFG